MNYKYLIGSFLSVPLLPIMYVQGKKIRRNVPELPEAKGTIGTAYSKSDKELRIITIGESTIAGVGVKTHEEGFTGSLARQLAEKLGVNIRWKVYAKSGYTAKTVRNKILPKIAEKNADLIVIGLGGNDAFKLNNPLKWKLSISRLIRDIQAKFGNTPIAFTNMPPIKEFPAFTSTIKWTIGNLVEILGKELAKSVGKFKDVYYNEEVLTLDEWVNKLGNEAEPEDFFSDGVHPSKLTYEEWGKDFANFLLESETTRSQIQSRIKKNEFKSIYAF